MASGASAPTGTPNSTVSKIEVVPRQGSGAASTGGAVGGTGSAGSTGTSGSTMTGDRVYRITLKMDDGATQVITQEWAPSFVTGDRVRMSGGAIER
ncbi:hypothetical protein [Massilia pseudoviolaceinigra]|uniref:hypothetical protein n=1 Tax=Massilia pseudoviolaceinigra TaxID=3057165 RepID=UPI002796BE7B|nr:hypothetical protein [Massilia sp. CCM 9206]MDQ1923876.1 hypothetical protein [Massilia sp. CCM 9206]